MSWLKKDPNSIRSPAGLEWRIWKKLPLIWLVGATFKSNAEIFTDTEFHYDILAKRLRELSFLNSGVKIELIDEVCYDFPELKFVMRHGADPWVDLAVKLLLKWPNLYYSTSAFAPKYWPKEIIDFANTRGSDKIIYAGYFPMGLTLERIFKEMDDVPFKDDVWPKFLHDNAAKVLGL